MNYGFIQHNIQEMLLYLYSSTCHERTPPGPGKSVRTLQVAAHQRDGWAGGDAKYNMPCKTTYITTITTSCIHTEYMHCNNNYECCS